MLPCNLAVQAETRRCKFSVSDATWPSLIIAKLWRGSLVISTSEARKDVRRRFRSLLKLDFAHLTRGESDWRLRDSAERDEPFWSLGACQRRWGGWPSPFSGLFTSPSWRRVVVLVTGPAGDAPAADGECSAWRDGPRASQRLRPLPCSARSEPLVSAGGGEGSAWSVGGEVRRKRPCRHWDGRHDRTALGRERSRREGSTAILFAPVTVTSSRLADCAGSRRCFSCRYPGHTGCGRFRS